MRAEEIEEFCYTLFRSAGYIQATAPDLLLVSPQVMLNHRALYRPLGEPVRTEFWGIRIEVGWYLDDEDYEVCRFMTNHTVGETTAWLSHDR